ncbi:MAG: pentapeptide repeat-containing protein [Chloroflexota bacterium]|nr:pentapeptide repeat-containing protein [Chloroflexota bacterium]
MTFLLLAMSGCGEPVGSGVHQYNPELDEDCMGCDLSGADLAGANLSHVDLSGANLDGVIGADFSRAKTVPPKYLKD